MTAKKKSAKGKNGTKRPTRKPSEQDLKRQVKELTKEVRRLREEKAELATNLGHALFGKTELDKEALFSQLGRRPTILDMIEELEHDGA